MHLLESIAMLLYLEEKLKVHQRVQVPVQVSQEAFNILVQVNKKLEGKIPEKSNYEVVMRDVLMALDTINKTTGLISLSDNMKDIVSDGVQKVRKELCIYAYRHFTLHELPTDVCETFDGPAYAQSPLEVLRAVADVAITQGLYRQ